MLKCWNKNWYIYKWPVISLRLLVWNCLKRNTRSSFQKEVIYLGQNQWGREQDFLGQWRSCPELASCSHAGIRTSCGRTLLLFFRSISIFFTITKPLSGLRKPSQQSTSIKLTFPALKWAFAIAPVLATCPLRLLRTVHSLLVLGGRYNCTQNLERKWITEKKHKFPEGAYCLLHKISQQNIFPTLALQGSLQSVQEKLSQNGLYCRNPKMTGKPAMYGFITTPVMKTGLLVSSPVHH